MKRDDWKAADIRIRSLAAEQAARDYELGEALLDAHRTCVAEFLGHRSTFEYTEIVLGWTPHTTGERQRTSPYLEQSS